MVAHSEVIAEVWPRKLSQNKGSLHFFAIRQTVGMRCRADCLRGRALSSLVSLCPRLKDRAFQLQKASMECGVLSTNPNP